MYLAVTRISCRDDINGVAHFSFRGYPKLELGARLAREVCRFKYPCIDSRVASEVVALNRVYLFATMAAEFSMEIAGIIPGRFFVIEKLSNSLANPLNRTLESVSLPQISPLFLSPSLLPILLRKLYASLPNRLPLVRKHALPNI